MEHVSVISPAQLKRFAELGVAACVQPAFLASESDWLFSRVGDSRRAWVYPFESMRRSGIQLVGSSDSPVEPPHPLWGIAAAVDRHGINPDEALTPLDALGMFTAGGASSLNEDEPLSVGAPVDMAVLDMDISQATPDEIHDTGVIATYVDGQVLEIDMHRRTWVD